MNESSRPTQLRSNWLGFQGIITLPAGAAVETLGTLESSLMSVEGASLGQRGTDGVLVIDSPEATVRLRRRPGTVQPMSLRVRVPGNAVKGSTHVIRVTQRKHNQRVVGGVTLELKIH